MMRKCYRCGELPKIHKSVIGGEWMFAIYCENHLFTGSACWYSSEEEAVAEWNIDSLANEFLSGDLTWEEACAKARSLARPNAYFPPKNTKEGHA